jgi:hypothetical protein
MKTQAVPGSFAAVFSPVFPARAGRSGGVSGASPNLPPVSRRPSEPVAAKHRPARPDHSGLPASLKDWLVCKAALEIRQRGCELTEDGNHIGIMTAKPATCTRTPPAASVRP